MILLHGPPGTGKTSLCKALAQKLAIRMADVYRNAVIVEVQSHSLFSKWFSESGKLVARLFDHIQELAEDRGTLVCILIDEVESLTSARQSAATGGEPSDAVRVVNAILTQLDAIRRLENVVTLCTSNLADSIDPAFIDRADIKAYIGLPPQPARLAILTHCFQELVRVGLIQARQFGAEANAHDGMRDIAEVEAHQSREAWVAQQLDHLAVQTSVRPGNALSTCRGGLFQRSAHTVCAPRA